MSEKAIKQRVYYVRGMHCASCEILIEKGLLELKGIKSVEASASKGEVFVGYEGKLPGVDVLNEIFQKENYFFSEKQIDVADDFKGKDFFLTFGIGILIILGFIGLIRLGLTGLINVTSSSSLAAFFIFGLLAGISTCAALIGGLVLSMSKQWSGLYSGDKSTFRKLQPHFMFNAGRLVSYAALGAVLGAVGNKLQISLQFTSILVIAVSLMMIFLALQMLGLKFFRRFQFTTPKFATRYIANKSNFKGRFMPFLLGAFTFFLPCGFTITAQGLALISGSPIQGSLIMLFFALGTLPMLLTIAISSVGFLKRPHLSLRFLKVAGFLVLFFAFYNINSQLNVLGFASLNDLNFFKNIQVEENGFPPVVNGKQVLEMEASASGYNPNYLKVRAGIPVRWEITDIGTSGCTNAVISRGLFTGDIKLTPGQTSVKEFTPTKPGKYKFSCWMGMVSGIIEVVEPNGPAKSLGNSTDINEDSVVSSGAQGCNCGCGGTNN